MGQVKPETAIMGGTAIHRKLSRAVRACGFDVLEEEPMGKYRLDIYVPELHMAFEADGPYHSEKHDTERDATLAEEYGLVTLRYSQATLQRFRTPDELMDNIRLRVFETCGDVAERRMRYMERLNGS